MAVIPTALQPGLVLSNTAQIIVSVASGKAVVKRAVFLNSTGLAAALTVYRVPAGGAPATANVIISARSIAAAGSDLAPELANMVIAPGESLQAMTDVATGVNAFVSGFTVS